MSSPRTSEQLIERWRAGDQEAADALYRRYAARLHKLAESQMGHRLARRVGPDDITQSVFRTFFRRTARGEYSFENSGALWSLLAQITLNKVRKHAERHRAAKRDVLAEQSGDNHPFFSEAVVCDPSPEDAAAFLDELETLLANLRDPEPEIVRLCLEGYSSSEIATIVSSSRWTVRRVLARVGKVIEARIERNSSG